MKYKLIVVLTFSANYIGATGPNQSAKEALLAAQLAQDKEELQNFVACNKNLFDQVADLQIKEKQKEIKTIEFSTHVFKALYEKKAQAGHEENSFSARVTKSTQAVEEKLRAILSSKEWSILRTANLEDTNNLLPLVSIVERIQQDVAIKCIKSPDKEIEYLAERTVILSILKGFLLMRSEK